MRHKARKQQNPQKTDKRKRGEGKRERVRERQSGREGSHGFMTGRLEAGRQAMIINRHKFKLSVTNWELGLAG